MFSSSCHHLFSYYRITFYSKRPFSATYQRKATCEQKRLRLACVSAHSDQGIPCSLKEPILSRIYIGWHFSVIVISLQWTLEIFQLLHNSHLLATASFIVTRGLLLRVQLHDTSFYGHSLPSTDSRRAVSGERMCTILVNRLED